VSLSISLFVFRCLSLSISKWLYAGGKGCFLAQTKKEPCAASGYTHKAAAQISSQGEGGAQAAVEAFDAGEVAA
jgi:hypothetical protein